MVDGSNSDFPKLAAPARRALASAGYERLEQLRAVTESELRKLHGMGSGAMDALRGAMSDRGLSFRADVVDVG